MNRFTGTLITMALALAVPVAFAGENQPGLNKTDEPARQIVGIGMGLSPDKETNRIIVQGAPAGTPAGKANILPGDIVVAVDGTPVDAEHFYSAIQHIRGVKGTTVKLTIEHNGKQRDVSLSRVEITIPRGGGCATKDHPAALIIK